MGVFSGQNTGFAGVSDAAETTVNGQAGSPHIAAVVGRLEEEDRVADLHVMSIFPQTLAALLEVLIAALLFGPTLAFVRPAFAGRGAMSGYRRGAVSRGFRRFSSAARREK